MAWLGVALVLGELGQSAAVTFHVSKYFRLSKELVRSSQLLTFLGAVVVTAIGVGTAETLAGGNADVAAAYRIAFAGCLINGIGGPYVYAMQAISIKEWNLLRLLQPGIYLLLVALAAVAGHLDLLSLSLILVVSIAGQMVWAFVACSSLNLTGGKGRPRLRSSLLKYGIAYSGSALPSVASSQLDKLALSKMVPASDLGLYAVASTMASLAYPFSTAIASVTFPRISRRDIGQESRRDIEARSLSVTLIVSLLVAIAVAVAAQPVIPWLFGDQFADAAVLTWWLVPAMVFRSCSQVMSASLRGRGRPGIVSWAQLGGLGAAAAGILLLTPMYGLVGTALGLAASELTVLVWTSLVLARVRALDGSRDAPVSALSESGSQV
jgi:O-antigen/teichoic acid export membrane protein